MFVLICPSKITLDLPERLDAKFVDAIYLRTVRSITPPPRLTIEQILQWADKHNKRTGGWPKLKSGKVTDAAGETWRGSIWHFTRVPAASPVARLSRSCLQSTAV